jgi:hypothetical protein
MKSVTTFGIFLATLACSNAVDGPFRATIQDTRTSNQESSEKTTLDEVPLSLELEDDLTSLSLLGPNPQFDYELTIRCSVYGSPWSKTVSRTQIDQRQVKVPFHGQNCHAYINSLTTSGDTDITFVPSIPSGTNGETLFGGYQLNQSEVYRSTTQLPSGLASATVILTAKFSIQTSGATVGYKFVTSRMLPHAANVALPSSRIFWNLPCGQTSPGPDSGNQLRGGGTHLYQAAAGQNEMILKVNGALCPPQDRARDIVFIFDVSSSMNRASRDPYQNPDTPFATCGRYQAYLNVLNTVGPGSRFAVITFGDIPITWSGGFFSDRNALEEHLVSQFSQNRYDKFKYGRFRYKKISDILCDAMDTDLGTDFTLALNKAIELSSQFRADAQREVYLLTDGRPVGSNSEGSGQADLLKSSHHVRLGTVLLNDSGSADDARGLLQRLASSPSLSVEANAAGDLASQLQSLTTNRIESATISLQAGGGAPITRSLPINSGLAFAVDWPLATGSPVQYRIQLDVTERLGARQPLTGFLTIEPRP